MKIKIENFGPIKEFAFDTDKKFHLIVGENNVGKSYALTVFYFVTKTLLEFNARHRHSYAYGLEDDDPTLENEIVREFSSKIKDKKTSSIPATSLYSYFAKDFLQKTIVESFSQHIRSAYLDQSSIANSLSQSDKAKITITTGSIIFTLEGNIDGFKVTNLSLTHGAIIRLSKQNRIFTMIKSDLVVYILNTDTPDESLTKFKIICSKMITAALLSSVEHVLDIDYLPASRSGLYQALSAFGQIIAELSKSRSFLRSKIELPGISGQLSDYFIKLTSIAGNRPDIESFERVASAIENDVLKGRIEYDYTEQKLFYRPHGTDLRLDISSTSSMVSETAPIVAYIRHIIAWSAERGLAARVRKGRTVPNLRKILIIEEPEAHLHPLNQIKMTKFYTDLTSLGVSIIMTSHSNYVFNKISNLVIDGSLKSHDLQCDLFHMTDLGSVGTNQAVDNYGIDDENFADASESLINERMELLMSDGDDDDIGLAETKKTNRDVRN